MSKEVVETQLAEAAKQKFSSDLKTLFPNDSAEVSKDLQEFKPTISVNKNMIARGGVSVTESEAGPQISITFNSEDALTSDLPKQANLRNEEAVHALQLTKNPDLFKRQREVSRLEREAQVLGDRDVTEAALLLQANAESYSQKGNQRFLEKTGIEVQIDSRPHSVLQKLLANQRVSKTTTLRIFAGLMSASQSNSQTDIEPEVQTALAMFKNDSSAEHRKKVESHLPEPDIAEAVASTESADQPVPKFTPTRRPPDVARMEAMKMASRLEARKASPEEVLTKEIENLAEKLDETELLAALRRVGVDLNLFVDAETQLADQIKTLSADQLKTSFAHILHQEQLSDTDIFSVGYALGEQVLEIKDMTDIPKKRELMAGFREKLLTKLENFDFSDPTALDRARGALIELMRGDEKQGIGQAVFEVALMNYGMFNDFSNPLSEADKAKISSPGYMDGYFQMIRETMSDPSFTHFGEGFNPYSLVNSQDEATEHVQQDIADLLTKVKSSSKLDVSVFIAMARELIRKQQDVVGSSLNSLAWDYQRQLDFLWEEKGAPLSEEVLFSLPSTAIADATELSHLEAESAAGRSTLDLVMEPVAKVIAELTSGGSVDKIDFGGGMMGSYSPLISEESAAASQSRKEWLKKLENAILKGGYPAFKQILQQTSIQDQQRVVNSFQAK